MSDRVERMLYQELSAEELARSIAALDTREEFEAYAGRFNLNDGVRVPTVLADHRLCARGVALMLLWGIGYRWLAGDPPPEDDWTRRYFTLFQTLRTRLLDGHYPDGGNRWAPSINRLQIYRLRAKGLPWILFGDLPPELIDDIDKRLERKRGGA